MCYCKNHDEEAFIYSAGQSMKRKFLLILSGNHIAIALVNQYKCVDLV
ncbi:hypothetical protein OIU79_006002 [Salix purpurea]|uniref:Uncharacterized protein n=1 Tax=Salix purpurea TaxID=77065 RepID=A0A9Q0TUJ8_SALPP|nr:hypothetical protein OIU79_006002 [Salix purpurea]